MTLNPNPVLRLITAGNVDDGKSTLIGRLLYDSQALLSDQIDQLHHQQSPTALPNFAALTDGLSAEREQGITIDVAYRYFTTSKRKFILADAPGHEQYTRNMVTAASTADAAIVLIDASRIDTQQQPVRLLPQTLRHTVLLKQLNCAHIVVAINKLDLLHYDQTAYDAIVSAYTHLAQRLQIASVHFVPISALHGDNIVHPSQHMPWYTGPSLLALLAELPSQRHQYTSATHTYGLFPVQRVARQGGSQQNDFRGYQGRLEQGRLEVGQRIRVLPSQQSSTIRAIYGLQGEQSQAEVGDVLTLTLDDELDISRGSTLVAFEHPIQTSQHLEATVCWFDTAALNPDRKYWLKHSTQTVYAKVTQLHGRLDLTDLEEKPVQAPLQMNDIARVSLRLQRPIAAHRYVDHHASGAFILIDDATHQTVAAGMIEHSEGAPA
ncbi:sulfate adenylyltransferase subunit 1 [Paenalcaligenes hominis]|uniref:sulfate adenylyltransferase subunit 1 n=1 Tax=Paenalcaligenes hominis TaxID=643674 RepID=UPI003523FC0D